MKISRKVFVALSSLVLAFGMTFQLAAFADDGGGGPVPVDGGGGSSPHFSPEQIVDEIGVIKGTLWGSFVPILCR